MATEIIEPDFAGEEMKLPEGTVATETVTEVPVKSIISGPIVVLLGLILAAILGGLYYWYYTVMSIPLTDPSTITRPSLEANNEPESTTAEARTGTLDVVSTSNELDAIEADVTSTNLDDLTSEITAIDSELEAALSAQ